MTIKYIPRPENSLADAISRNPPDTAEVSDIPEMIPYTAMIARINHVERKPIRLSRDLLEIAELGLHCAEYNEIIKRINEGVDVKDLPSDHILKQFVRKKKKTGEMVSAYDEHHTIDTGRGELVYLSTKLVPPRNARPGIVESAYQGHFSPDTMYNYLKKYYFWPQMFKFVEAKAKTCDSCRKHKK